MEFLFTRSLLQSTNPFSSPSTSRECAVSQFLTTYNKRFECIHCINISIPLGTARNMVLAERCALLSAEVLKSQGKYSDAATLLIKMTSEVGTHRQR